ncbi:major facilitator superfamily transporter [Moniliophthora roreri]|nr:major facilitator superfamily transporter [Moniliophthora roreri]
MHWYTTKWLAKRMGFCRSCQAVGGMMANALETAMHTTFNRKTGLEERANAAMTRLKRHNKAEPHPVNWTSGVRTFKDSITYFHPNLYTAIVLAPWGYAYFSLFLKSLKDADVGSGLVGKLAWVNCRAGDYRFDPMHHHECLERSLRSYFISYLPSELLSSCSDLTCERDTALSSKAAGEHRVVIGTTLRWIDEKWILPKRTEVRKELVEEEQAKAAQGSTQKDSVGNEHDVGSLRD